MKKQTIPVLTAVAIGVLLLNSYFAFSTLNGQAQSTAGSEWLLNITGLVEHSLNLTLANITAMPQTTIDANIYCVDFPNRIVTGGSWKGVKLSLLLEEAGVAPTVSKVAFYASDGYSTDLDVVSATSENVILAYEKDGEPLAETFRLVVPWRWGYKWISQVTRIVLVNYDFKGMWESAGYSDSADVQQSPNFPAPQPQVTPKNSTSSQSIEPTAPPATAVPSNSSSSVPSQEEESQKPEASSQTPETIPATLITSAVAMVVVSACLLAYLWKRRH